MEVHDLIEHGYKCKKCQFFTKTHEEIKDHTSSSHSQLLAKKQKLSEPGSIQTPNNKSKTWKDIFQVAPHVVTKKILGSLDHETFLACRLVCQGWRSAVNRYKPKWKEIKSFSFQDALSKAIKGGQTLVAEMLISNVADFELIEDFEFDECRPMHIAARVGKICMVEMLIANGARVGLRDGDGRTPLFIAAGGDSLQIVNLLISKGADINCRNSKDEERPLHRASRGKNAAIVESLLWNGANVNLKNENGESPLHLASATGEASIVEVLLKNGAEVDAMNYHEDTALQIAARGNFASVVELLVSNGADIDKKDEWNNTPLELAASEHSCPEVVKSLVNLYGVDEQTRALSGAVHCGRLEVVDVLLSNGVNPNVIEKGSPSIIKNAAYCKHWDIIALLLKHGANPEIDIINGIEYTILHRTVCHNNLAGVELLLSHGANIQGQEGYSALFFADSAEMVELLCKYEPNLNVRNEDNETPLQMFERKESQNPLYYKKIVNILKRYRSKQIASKLKCYRAVE